MLDGKKGSERGRSGATKSSSFLPFNHPLLSLPCALYEQLYGDDKGLVEGFRACQINAQFSG